MQSENQKIKYYAASYARLSNSDEVLFSNAENANEPSNSIINQQELIKHVIKSHPEIKLVKEYADDGRSGVNFDRPYFQNMLEDIKAKKINCVIVKDLSRLGRNYIELGELIERIFPSLNVRFISINDNYDSNLAEPSDDILLPFKNLVNESYSRDLSMKIRSSLKIKKQKGDFASAHAPYGYNKAEDNRYQLEADHDIAPIIRKMFQLKIEGYSNQTIADYLNENDIPSPYEYKKQRGDNYYSGLVASDKAIWRPNSVSKVLTNAVYIGVLEQGKSTRINYKVRTQVKNPEEKWIRQENAHESIVSVEDFELVQKLMKMDLRVAPGSKTTYLLSGLLVCAECGDTLIRKAHKNKPCDNKYGHLVYYACYSKDRKIKCEDISVREEDVEEAVFTAIKKQITSVVEFSELLETIDNRKHNNLETVDLDKKLDNLNSEEIRIKYLKKKLFEDLHDEFLSKEDYRNFYQIYEEQEIKIKNDIIETLKMKEELLNGAKGSWMERVLAYANATELDRRMLVTLVDEILVYSNNKIEICFSFQDEYEKEIEKYGFHEKEDNERGV